MKAEELRKSILQLAIQGKLVGQDPADEPTSVLLERIRAEKQRLIKDGKIKKDKLHSVIYRGDESSFFERIGKEVRCIDDEIPFEIPDSWEWVRFNSVVNFTLGKTPERDNKSYWGDDYRWVSISDMNDKCTLNTTKEAISALGFKSKFNNVLSPKGTLLMSFKLTIGKVSILGIDAVHNEAIISIFPYYDNNEAIKFFLYNFLSLFTGYTSSTDAIKGATLNSSKIREMLIPLPPLAEQERIVARLGELEPLLAEYERLELQESALEKSFPEDLNKSILQYAIQGKLVSQDPADEPASVLLDRIRAEKEQLIKDKKIKRDKTDSHIFHGEDGSFYERIGKDTRCIDDEIPFEIPTSWEWCRLNSIMRKVASGSTPKGGSAVYVDEGIKFIRSQNVYSNGLRLDNIVYIPNAIHKSKQNSCVNPRDMLLNITGASIGRCAIVPEDFDTANINQHILILRLIDTNILYFIHSVIISPFVFQKIMDIQVGGTKEGLSAEKANRLLIPIPPLSEQQRIVAKLQQISTIIK